jgi:WD40 repeat protein
MGVFEIRYENYLQPFYLKRTLRVWTLSGECLYELCGHTSFIYSVTVLSDNETIASVGEDRSLRLWQGVLSCFMKSSQKA